jgi:hypothetical protein
MGLDSRPLPGGSSEYVLPSTFFSALYSSSHALTLHVYAALGFLGTVAGAIPSGQRQGHSFYEHVAYLGVREYQCGLNAVDIQNLLPQTATTCRRFARRHGLELSTIQLPEDTMAIRLGAPQSDRVVVLFHGGGYMAPALNSHMSSGFGFSSPPRKDITVYVLLYSKSSDAHLQNHIWPS